MVGTVVGYIPYWLRSQYPQELELGTFKYLGWLFILFGVLLYGWSALTFLLKGDGTPAIWFTKHLKFLVGEEPRKIVTQGLYRFSRNPMYVGVLSFVVGEAFLLESRVLLTYSLIVSAVFYLTVVLVEEPHLKKKYGQEYVDYLQSTPRWLSILPRREK